MPEGRQRKPVRRRRRKHISGMVGVYASDLLTGHALFLLTLLLGALVALSVRWISTYVNDPHFEMFAHLMHLIVMGSDGLIFVIWLLRWIVSSVREGL
jgi:fructose-specific phosphotransferase system IIC component